MSKESAEDKEFRAHLEHCRKMLYIHGALPESENQKVKARISKLDLSGKKLSKAKRPFDFEKYWKVHGIHTNPAIMGLAFKECSKKAVDAALS